LSKLAKKTLSYLRSIDTWMQKEGIVIRSKISAYPDKKNIILKPATKRFSESSWDSEEMHQKEKLSVYASKHVKKRKVEDFTFLMIDSAIIQCYYNFDKENLVMQKMAFYQSPFVKSFDSDPKSYLDSDPLENPSEEENLGAVTCFRFDYNLDDFEECLHPKTHLHLGSFKNCRIPVISPLKIATFFSFIIKNFYSVTYKSFQEHLKINKGLYNKEGDFSITVTDNEMKHLHLSMITKKT